MSADNVVWVDDFHDRESASDGVSRFGAYVRQRAHLFADGLDGPLRQVDFAATAWAIACSPVMSPGYVRARPDVWAVTCFAGEEGRVLVADVEVRLPWPPEWRNTGSVIGWTGWARSTSGWGEPPVLVEPEDKAQALLVTVHLRVPIAAELLARRGMAAAGTTPCRPSTRWRRWPVR